MNDFIFNENMTAEAPRLLICGFSDEYGKMLRAVMAADFILSDREPDLIIADETAHISYKNIPVIVLGKVEAKRKNKIYLRRPVSLSALRQTALSLVSQKETKVNAPNIVIINDEILTVSFGGKSVSLTSLEFRLFNLLYKANAPVSRETIRKALWPSTEDTNICDVYICYLRKKLESLFGKGFIVSLRGKGYLLRLP